MDTGILAAIAIALGTLWVASTMGRTIRRKL
jgi:hypothetical protein